MKRWGWVLSVAVALVAALAGVWPARPAYAANCEDDQRVMGGSYALAEGEELDRNLIVLGGNASIAEGATLHCTLVVIGGNADVAGTVEGDVAAFGGNVTVRSTGVLKGELAQVGGAISCEAGAVGCSGGEVPTIHIDGGDSVSGNPFIDGLIGFYQRLVQLFLTALVMGVLAVLVVVFWPEQTGRAATAITTAPGASGGLGVLTLVAVPVILVLITITVCLIPVSLVGAVIFAAAILMGWIALGYIVGTRLTTYLNLRQISPAVAAGFGTAVLWLLSGAIGEMIPCVGWVAGVILGAVGLGAVTLTRFGTQPYLPYNPPPMTPRPPAPSEPPASAPPPLPPAEPPAPAGDAPDLSAL
jgi:hypothetical protein